MVVIETGPLAAGKYGEDVCDLPNATLNNLLTFLRDKQDQVEWRAWFLSGCGYNFLYFHWDKMLVQSWYYHDIALLFECVTWRCSLKHKNIIATLVFLCIAGILGKGLTLWIQFYFTKYCRKNEFIFTVVYFILCSLTGYTWRAIFLPTMCGINLVATSSTFWGPLPETWRLSFLQNKSSSPSEIMRVLQ